MASNVLTRTQLVVALALEGDALPTEFRLFVSGWNDTENGRFLFDSSAAEAVMSAYGAHEVDRMIDLEHLSLDAESANFDPDARGWCKLEVREDGSLWAVGVTWTPDGESRLRDKRQRYVSPAFEVEAKSNRITKIINIALTALPATHGTPELVAARAKTKPCTDRRTLSTGASLNDLQRAVQAALLDMYPPPADDAYVPGPWVLDVFDESAVYEYDGHLYEVAYVFDGSVATLGAPTEVQRSYEPVSETETTRAATPASTAALSAGGDDGMDPKLVQEALDALASGDNEKAAELLKSIIAAAASNGDPPEPGEVDAEETDVDPDEEDEEPAAALAASARLVRLTGKATLAAAVEEVETWRSSHLDLEKQRADLAKERAALETAERRKLCVDLVTLAGRAPATVWADPKAKTPKKYLAAMAIGDLREYVKDAVGASSRGGKPPSPPSAVGGNGMPSGEGGQEFATEHGQVTLSAREIKLCTKKKIDPAAYAANRAAMRGRGGKGEA